MDPPAPSTILFTTIGRVNYAFDVFSVKLPNSNLHYCNFSDSDENRLTDGVSINFNAQFINQHDQSVVFVSERDGCPRIYLSKSGIPKMEQLPFVQESLFHDRPIIKNNRLYFVSAHEQPDQPLRSWCAVYTIDLDDRKREITRLTPSGVIDFSPSISHCGKFLAVASYGSRPWGGEFHELYTDIVVFSESEPDKRTVVCERGGWPSWSRDSSIFFHRQADDGWWSIFQVNFSQDVQFSVSPITPLRVTPPGVHCFTPAALHEGKRIAVATRRPNNNYRHIELFDLSSRTFYPVTESLNPSFHHYNPFVSPNSTFLGYHRYRGDSNAGESTIPNLEPVMSPVKDIRIQRINGAFPSFSPDGDLIACNPQGLHIMKSNGSRRWTLIKDRTAFCNSWSPTEKNVIFTSLGPIFASENTAVQIARVTFDPSNLNDDHEEIPCDIKILTKEGTGNNAFPSCSPDGKSVVFRSGRSGHKNLYILDAVNGEFNGYSVRQLTEGAWNDTMPSWSPKGDVIAFSSNRHNAENPGGFGCYVIKSDGSDLKRIELGGAEKDKERINHVCFSRDGEWLLFTGNLGSVTAEPVSWPNQYQPYGDLYVMRLDGSGLRRLTFNAYEDGTPTWFCGRQVECLALDKQVGERLAAKFDEPMWLNESPPVTLEQSV